MIKNKKIILIISSILIALVLVIGGTLAYFVWNADKEALVNVTVSSGAGSCELIDDNGVGIFPTYSKYHGRKIKLHAKQEVAEKAYITWEMVIKQINNLQDETVMYELVNNTTGESYGTGTFGNVTSEEGSNTIVFSNNNEVLAYNRDYEFTLYLWIDGTNGINSLDMTNETIDFDMACSITGTDQGTIAESNVLMIVENPPTSGSNFLNGTLTRDQISSVTFLEDATIPADAIDVSENNDNSVMMWYGAVNADNLYDVYIGSRNGKVIIEDASYLFMRLSNITKIDLSKTNTSFLKSLRHTFNNCPKLLSLDIGYIDTSNVTDMFATFGFCKSLTELDLRNFDTSNVTTMSGMFVNCNSLLRVNLNSFDTSNVTDMSGMFGNCQLLTNIYISHFDTSKVENMGQMFQECFSLVEIDLSNFNTSNVKNMYSMFYDCKTLTTLDLHSFDTKNVENMQQLFQKCTLLTNLNIKSFVTSNVTTMSSMFAECVNLEEIDVSRFDTSKVTTMRNMFDQCMKLISLDLSSFNTENVEDMQFMFRACNKLTELDVSKFDTSKVKNMNGMFSYVTLTSLDLKNFNTTNVTELVEMFAGCLNLSYIDIRNFNVTNITDSTSVFDTVPDSCNIIVNYLEQKNWIIALYPSFDNITVLKENV